jgi:hypothetical protein
MTTPVHPVHSGGNGITAAVIVVPIVIALAVVVMADI